MDVIQTKEYFKKEICFQKFIKIFKFLINLIINVNVHPICFFSINFLIGFLCLPNEKLKFVNMK